MRTVSETIAATRLTAVSPTTSTTPPSACEVDCATIPSAISFRPTARAGSTTICNDDETSAAIERARSARNEIASISRKVRNALRNAVSRRVLRELRRLQPVHRRVPLAAGNQLVVRPVLDDASMLDDDDAVGAAHRREAVRDDDGRHSARQLEEARVDLRFAAEVERRSGLVEDQHARARAHGEE